MNIKFHNQKKYKYLEKIKWLLISILLILPILINNYFNEINIFIRVFTIFILISLSISIILCTRKGKNIWLYINSSHKEMKKIIWPSYKETLYTTFGIICITVIMSLLLWGIDSIIFRFIAFIIRLRF